MNNQDYAEDQAALREHNFDVEGEMWCWELDIEAYFKEDV